LKLSEISSINFSSEEDEWVIPKNYDSYEDLTISDHKPIISEFEINVGEINIYIYIYIYFIIDK